MNKVMEKWKQKLRHLKKEDYIVLLLAGVLLLILALPAEKEKEDFFGETEKKDTAERKEASDETEEFNNNGSYEFCTYVDALEKQVEEILSGMEGAGEVKVMITVSDMGTDVLERDREVTTSGLVEADNAGGSRKNTESSQREEVIYRRDADGNEIPYVVQRKLPEVTGVVVTAQGAGNTKVKENIIGAVSVLFNLNEHRIKVIRMKS